MERNEEDGNGGRKRKLFNVFRKTANNNVTPYIANLVGRSLHRQPAHPLGIIKSKIEECVRARARAKWMLRALFVASPCARAGSRG